MQSEEVELGEDGHADVASAIRQCKTVMEDAQQIMAKLQNESRTYLVDKQICGCIKQHEQDERLYCKSVKKIIGKLKGLGQAKI